MIDEHSKTIHEVKESVQVVEKVIKAAVDFSESMYKKLFKPFIAAFALAVMVAGYSFYNEESFWIILPLVVPMAIVAFSMYLLDGVISIKDNVDEISECLSSLKKIKDLKVNKESKGLKFFKDNILAIKDLLSALGDVSTLKDAPSMVLDAIGAIRSFGMLANPMSLIIIFASVASLWAYNVVLILVLLF